MTASGALWRNWGRSESVRPKRVERPTSVGAVQRAVVAALNADLRIKAVGAAHSFSGIAVAQGVQVDLHSLRGLIDVDAAAGRVTLAAGTSLRKLPGLLEPHGLALPNMGGSDRQTIVGATSTGTHGTGDGFEGLATQVVALTLVTGDGTLLHVSETENADLLPATRLALGALGIIVDVTLQCVPSFLLHSVERIEPLAEVLEAYLERSASIDHFGFDWFPHTESALTKSKTRLPADAERLPRGQASRWFKDKLLANVLFRASCSLGAAVPALVPGFNRMGERLSGRREVTDVSTSVFLTNSPVRFREMEYAIPRAAVPAAFRELRALIERKGWRISFPITVVSAAADDLWLSTASDRESGYIAVRRYFREDSAEYFQAVEAIMRAHNGRPHWGKIHFQDADSLRTLYPHFDDFLTVRDRLDPERRFSNPYLERVLGQ